MTVSTYKWSMEEWHRLIELGIFDNKSVELLNGDIVEMSPEGIPHSYTNLSVADYLRNILAEKAIIRESHPITLNNSEPEPDIAVVRLPKTIYAQHHPYPQDIYWLIEVSKTTLQFDLNIKAEVYASNNIPEYWIIDLVNKKVIAHTLPNDNSYSQIVEYQVGFISPQTFSDIMIPLSELIVI